MQNGKVNSLNSGRSHKQLGQSERTCRGNILILNSAYCRIMHYLLFPRVNGDCNIGILMESVVEHSLGRLFKSIHVIDGLCLDSIMSLVMVIILGMSV